jgi:ABC-type glycerol-3-phosphate transport system permease component
MRPGSARAVTAVLVSLVFVAPLAYMLLGALRQPGLPLPQGFSPFPSDPSLASFGRAFDVVDLGREFLNSVFVAVIAVPLTVVTASWAGYAMTRLPARARRFAIGVSLVGLMIPLSALWVPRFVIFKELSLTDTYVPLIAPALMGTTPLYVLLFYWSYRRIPADLVDAARLEGLGPFAVWRRVAAPLVRPTTFAVGTLAFLFYWSNFVDPLLYLSSPEKFTLPLGLSTLKGLVPSDFPVLLAGTLVATIPAVIAFALVQGRFLRSTRAAGWLGR